MSLARTLLVLLAAAPLLPRAAIAANYNLFVTSSTEKDATTVAQVSVTVFNGTNGTTNAFYSNIGLRQQISVAANDIVEIKAPREVYMDLFGSNLTDSATSDPQQILDQAEERFTALGISVNDVPQTGDPTFYRFKMPANNVEVIVKWLHEYALVIEHDFTDTQSQERDPGGNPWAGPLTSEATGNPMPEAKKHWIKKGDTQIALIDGSVLDFSRAGLDIRYVPKSYRAAGPPNRNTTQDDDARNIAAGQPLAEDIFAWEVGQAPPQRRQVPEFSMYGPAKITFVWQIQFGVKVNVDGPAHAALPKVFEVQNGTDVEIGGGEGTFWFNPGGRIKVATAATEAGLGSPALTAWINGDGFYFSSSGGIDSDDGSLIQGGPAIRTNGSPVAIWDPMMTLNPPLAVTYRGLVIPQLGRAARVMWTYGTQQIKVNARIGEFVFQNDPTNASIFITQPDQITLISVSGANKNVSEAEMTIWDQNASRLYPLVPGKFKAKWRPDPALPNEVEVIVTATYPSPAHYPHIANTPAVALDPDANDTFVFKALKYTENSAAVDGSKRFTAALAGKTVLLFSEIQLGSRGQPQEFLRVRVVDTRTYDDGLIQGEAVIGQKIQDPALDRANLDTGYLMSFEQATGQPDKTRHNPFIYNAGKLTALAAKDIYDMAQLRSDTAAKVVVKKQNLPGPIIPVNLHPGAQTADRLIVVWYDDPARNDLLLWPYQAKVYLPRWPVDVSEGLGRIVIASQWGSESQVTNSTGQLADQEVVPAVMIGTNVIPAETTYNPSRLQQVQIYNQPDPTRTGYNPNEEHALTAASLRYASVSPRPPAIYALRDNDLNNYLKTSSNEQGQPAGYTSHPFVLVQFLDTADNEFKMRVYQVLKEDISAGYRFASQTLVATNSFGTNTASPRTMQQQPYVTMKAGEPVIPFYPLGVVIGASPCSETFGINLKGQAAYWEDWRGTSWAASGGEDAWFTVSFYYPMAPDFWWPNEPGFIRSSVEGSSVVRRAAIPQAGDSISFLPQTVNSILALTSNQIVSASVESSNRPTQVLYKSDWPDNPAVLKSGETLTFSGGEYHSDHPLRPVVGIDGEIEMAETPGLPGILAFASAEVVFDSLNPKAVSSQWKDKWTARVAQVLDQRSVPLSTVDFPAELQPATKRTRVKKGMYVFNDLPASLQKRVSYDPLSGQLRVIGLVNDKEIGDRTLTAAPPAVFILEPNIITAEEATKLAALSQSQKWVDAVASLVKLTRNPSLLASTNTKLPNLGASDYQTKLEKFWRHYYFGVLPSDSSSFPGLSDFPTVAGLSATAPVPTPISIADADSGYLVGLDARIVKDGNDRVVTVTEVEGAVDPANPPKQFPRTVLDPKNPAPARAFGPGLALLPNPDFLDPKANPALPDISWVTVVENNDSSLGGSPITLHVIQVDRRERYRGAIKTVVSDNVFDENLVLRHTGDFGASADQLTFEWWYRPDDGSLDVPPPDLIPPGQSNPWKLFPDPTGNRGMGRFQVTLKGNPNAPEALLADTWWFVRYRHNNDDVSGTNWKVPQTDASGTVVDNEVNFTWAGAGNSDPFHDYDNNGVPDYKAQLAQGWIKRVLDAVNPYEARIRDFEGDNPATVSSMISEFGQRYEGPVALNPDKNVIENVGLIELYQTILDRGRNLSINLSQPVSTPAIANALEFASTRIADFYTILGNEAYTDALDPTIGFGSDSVEYGSLAPAVFAFQNQASSLLDEELDLLRGVDDYFARPVYNRLFWNFTKGEGEAAYAMNYNISDINQDGFIDEKDAMILFPQGHGDAWGHYLTALGNQYELLRHPYFNWVSRSEFYNLMDIVIKVDFLDERKFAQTAAAKAKVGAEVVNMTYRSKYVEDPNAQWQGYTDSNKDRAWGVQEWARRAGQGAYFDWIVANALLPSQHPNDTLEGIQKVDRQENSDIAVISANLNAVQSTFDQANKGMNPLGLAPGALVFDIDPTFLEVGSTAQIGTRAVQGLLHFDQIYERALKMLQNAVAVWDNANEDRNRLRQIANSEIEFRNSVFQEDLSYKNQLIKLFGKPYEGTIGPGRVYPAGYDGPDLQLYMYVDVRNIDNSTVPGPTTDFATFNSSGTLTGGDIYQAFKNGQGSGSIGGVSLISGNIGRQTLATFQTIDNDLRRLFDPTFAQAANGTTPIMAQDGLYNVNYTDLTTPKVPLANLTQLMPVTAAGYTFQAPREWGSRRAAGDLQILINQMLQQEAQIATAIGAWDSLQGDIVRTLRLINAKVDMTANLRLKNEIFSRIKNVTENVFKGIEGAIQIIEGSKDVLKAVLEPAANAVPNNLPTAGLAVSPGDALSAARAGFGVARLSTEAGMSIGERALAITKLVAEIALSVSENEMQLFDKREEDAIAVKEMIVELENKVGDEPIKRIEIFKEIQALREMSDQYRALVDEGARLIDERGAYNKRVAAQTQRSRYQDMTFRVAQNHALQTYRSAFDLAAQYAYLAAKAYDYETNFDPSDPGSPSAIFGDIMRARTLGLFADGEPRLGNGGLAETLAKLKANYEVLKGQLGINNPQIENGKISLRTEFYRILPKNPADEVTVVTYLTNSAGVTASITTVSNIAAASSQQPNGLPAAGMDSDALWQKTLRDAWVDDLWMVPEYRYFCRPFAGESDASGNHVAEPGLVLQFGSEIVAGKNFFGKPLSGGDHAYDPTHFATKIQSVGVWLSDYLSSDLLSDLPATPRLYLVPVGSDVMSVPTSEDPNSVRVWKVVDQRIPVPIPAVQGNLGLASYIPLLDSLGGRMGEPRKYSALRAYHDGGSEVNMDELVQDTRLVGRSIWNTRWLLIIPGRMLNYDPAVGLQRFIEQVSDIKLVFRTYSISGG